MHEPTDPRRALPSPVLTLPVCGHCDETVDPTLHLPCPTCGAHAHDHCLVQHGGCPTPGCEVTGPVARATVAARTLPPMERVAAMPLELRSRRVRRGISLLGGFSFSLGAGGMLLSALALGSPGGLLLGTAGLVMGATFAALGSWLHSLVTMLGAREVPASLRTISLALAGICLGAGLVGMLGSAVGLGVLDAGLASPLGLRQAVAGGA
ncbi:MAG: hypothetical protein AAF211_01515, partial [Myxococcota bacterium]